MADYLLNVPTESGSQWPTNFRELVNFIIYFNGNKQPLVHDYPWLCPMVAVPLYWAFVYFGPKFMKNREPIRATLLLQLWNLLLTVVSVGMFAGMIEPLLRFLWRKGFYELVCQPRGDLYYGAPFFCIWLFGLSKYFELIDTVFLVLRKREVSFLHWYHHTTVLVYTWFSLAILTPPGAIFGVVNTFVHSIMYFYFFLTSCGYRPSWGKAVTVIQLLQMAVGIATASFWSYYYLSGARCPIEHPNAYMFSSLILYGSYFALFYSFYRNRYVLLEKERLRKQKQKEDDEARKKKAGTGAATTKSTTAKKVD